MKYSEIIVIFFAGVHTYSLKALTERIQY